MIKDLLRITIVVLSVLIFIFLVLSFTAPEYHEDGSLLFKVTIYLAVADLIAAGLLDNIKDNE